MEVYSRGQNWLIAGIFNLPIFNDGSTWFY